MQQQEEAEEEEEEGSSREDAAAIAKAVEVDAKMDFQDASPLRLLLPTADCCRLHTVACCPLVLPGAA